MPLFGKQQNRFGAASNPSSMNIATLYAFASPLMIDQAEEDLWLRFTAENANATAGAYISINGMTFNGLVIRNLQRPCR